MMLHHGVALGEVRQIGLIFADDIGREMIVGRAMAHGHFDGPDFIHPEAGGGDLIKSQISGEQKNRRARMDSWPRRGDIGRVESSAIAQSAIIDDSPSRRGLKFCRHTDRR